MVVSLIVGNGLRPLLCEVRARDPFVYGAVALSSMAVAVLACVIPAARATRIDPLAALRAE